MYFDPHPPLPRGNEPLSNGDPLGWLSFPPPRSSSLLSQFVVLHTDRFFNDPLTRPCQNHSRRPSLGGRISLSSPLFFFCMMNEGPQPFEGWSTFVISCFPEVEDGLNHPPLFVFSLSRNSLFWASRRSGGIFTLPKTEGSVEFNHYSPSLRVRSGRPRVPYLRGCLLAILFSPPLSSATVCALHR